MVFAGRTAFSSPLCYFPSHLISSVTNTQHLLSPVKILRLCYSGLLIVSPTKTLYLLVFRLRRTQINASLGDA
jgi:hypothetical protein